MGKISEGRAQSVVLAHNDGMSDAGLDEATAAKVRGHVAQRLRAITSG